MDKTTESAVQRAKTIQETDGVRLRLALSMAMGTPRVSTAGVGKAKK